MPEIKHLFNAGRMNKDLDERLIPNGEYRDALNIQLASTDGNDAGAIQNIIGNSKISSSISFTNPVLIASTVDASTEKIYWIVKDTSASYLLSYDGSSVSIIIQDVNNVVFNFSNNLITGIAIFEKQLAITDNVNEPYVIDLEYFESDQVRPNPTTSHTQIFYKDNWQDLTTEDVVLIKKKPASAPVLSLNSSGGVENADPLFELKFIRFAYRWKFKNGQYSVFSPFSEVAFLPGIFEFNAKKGYNTGMENTVKSISLTGIDTTVNNIESIDVLMKKSDDQSIYVVETLLLEDFPETYELTSEQIYSIVASDQLLRLWDAVPLKAKAVEISSNRLIFGNYEIGENTADIKPQFNVNIQGRGGNRKHIKSDRTYQFGIVFEDQYGRQTPVISNRSGSINVPFGNLEQMNAPQQFSVSMADTLPSSAATSFDKFKYFIKDTAGEYYNVIAESIFPNPEKLQSSEVWMALPSTEINKFNEGDFLLLKKGQNSSIPIANPLAKFKTLAVESSAPDFIGIAPSNPTAVAAVTNFDYENYDTSGRFFVKLEDIDGILYDLYQANVANNAVAEEIPESSFGTASYPSGSYLGEYRIYDSGGGYIEKDFYFSEVSGAGNVAVFTQNGYGSGTAFSNPQGTLVTEDITSGSVTVDGTNANYKWYNAGTYTYSDGFTRTIYTKWTPAESIGVDYDQLNTVAILPVEGEEVDNIDPAVFETEPAEGFLDIYYETEESFDISEYGDTHLLRYFNCYNFQNGVESNRIRDDYNAVQMDKQVRVSTVLAEQYKRSRNTQGLIWSGLYNSRNSVNRLNQFSAAEPITKDLDPEYGSIQLLHTRDTDVIAFCEDKVLRIQADKDSLYNADGSTNVVSSNNVLGQAVPYGGEFGISKNPESFTYYGYQAYFTDKARGAVLRLSRDGLTLLSSKNMNSYFRDKLKDHNSLIIGSYDIHTRQYILSFEGDESLAFSETVDGWTTRLSFIPESGLYLNGDYFTFNGSQLWKHHSSGINNFYGAQYDSSVKFIFNNEPSVVKNFKTLSYEGTQGKNLTTEGWQATSIETDLQSGKVTYFKGKEGKWFNNIEGISNNLSNIDSKEFSVQGIGSASNVIIPFSCVNAGFTVSDGTVGEGIDANISSGSIVNITPSTYQLGTIEYTAEILAPSGYSNSGSTINCNSTAIGIPTFTCDDAAFTVADGTEGETVQATSVASILSISPSTYQVGLFVYTGTIMVPSGFSNSGSTINCTFTANGTAIPEYTCAEANFSVLDGTEGDTVQGTATETIISITPATYQLGTNTYTAVITIPSGYLNAGGTISCTDTATGSTADPIFDCSAASFNVSDGTVGNAVSATSSGTIVSISPSTYQLGTTTYVGTITAPAGYSNVGSNISCSDSAAGSDGGDPDPTFDCGTASFTVYDGEIGNPINAISSGTIVSITPSTYQFGTTTYTGTITAPSGYTNAGYNINCTDTASGSTNPVPDPTFTCTDADFSVSDGNAGDIVQGTANGSIVSISPSTYQSGTNTYTGIITVPSGFDNPGSTVSCTDTASGAVVPTVYYARFITCGEPEGAIIQVQSSSPISTTISLEYNNECYEWFDNGGVGADGDISTFAQYVDCSTCQAALTQTYYLLYNCQTEQIVQRTDLPTSSYPGLSGGDQVTNSGGNTTYTIQGETTDNAISATSIVITGEIGCPGLCNSVDIFASAVSAEQVYCNETVTKTVYHNGATWADATIVYGASSDCSTAQAGERWYSDGVNTWYWNGSTKTLISNPPCP